MLVVVGIMRAVGTDDGSGSRAVKTGNLAGLVAPEEEELISNAGNTKNNGI